MTKVSTKDEQDMKIILTFSQIMFRAACMFQYPGHHRATTGDWVDKWWRVSPDQSPGPGMIDSGSTGEEQAIEQ